MIGQQLSHFKVTGKLGEGGMGEVYRAQDTRLGRDVAIKVLPQELVQLPDRMARFEREAQLLASLNHPNIGAIHGLEEAAGQRFLVLELIEGEDLAERLARGPMPLDDTMRVALQIAEALEAAHEKGIVHRDLKPANVKITPDGQVKVLDFGLAKALEEEPSAQDLQNSPTLTAAATQAGIILGTAAYMAPEQAAGETADRRADIWSFGVVLSEMLTGRQQFTGQTVSHVLAAVLKDDPNWAGFPTDVPQPILDLIQRCLRKERGQRLQAIGDARIAIEEYLADPEAALAPRATVDAPAQARTPVVPWAIAAIALVGLAVALWRPWIEPPELPAPTRLTVDPGAEVTLGVWRGAYAVISPDGRRLAFVGEDDQGQDRLYARPLDQAHATALNGTEGARKPFFSPDGEWIGFFTPDRELKKISFLGGAAVTLSEVPSGRGGAWTEDGRILFPVDNRSGLSWIPEAGGTPEELTTLAEGELSHRYPQALPGGNRILYTAHLETGVFAEGQLVIHDLDSGERTILHRGAMYGRYLASGHIAFAHEDTLFVAPVDLDVPRLTAPPVPAIEDLSTNPVRGTAQYDVSRNGTIVYQTGRSASLLATIDWLSVDGRQPLLTEPAEYSEPEFSPDGRYLAVQIDSNAASDVWVYEIGRDVLTRLTFAEEDDENPHWTPDGKRIAFDSNRHGGADNLYWKRADGAGTAQRLAESAYDQRGSSWHPNGRILAFIEHDLETGWDIWTLPLEGDEESGWRPGTPEPFLNTPFVEVRPKFSPDGRWLAYVSNESDRFEVYVRPFPGPGGKWQISTEGGSQPSWSPVEDALLYRDPGGRLMSVSYSVNAEAFRADRPVPWSETTVPGRGITTVYALHPEGRRLATLWPPEEQNLEVRDELNVIFEFFTDLERIAP